ncbi:MAG TPA: DoxX family protein [Stellaceae bacterium]|nr:DoxX family protein [Stellaceae bacterium]
MNDTMLLVGRVLIALVFLMTAWLGSPNPGYIGSLGLSPPLLWSWIAIIAEALIVISLILGIETRWGAVLGMVYVVIATALAHRYWQAPQAQFVAQYSNFAKNLAILGGLILVYVSGAGAYSIDAMRSAKRATG